MDRLDPKGIIEHWAARLLSDPRLSSQINGVVKIFIREPRQSFIFECFDIPKVSEGAKVSERETSAECEIEFDGYDLPALRAGELSYQLAYLEGRIVVRGDALLALRFSTKILTA